MSTLSEIEHNRRERRRYALLQASISIARVWSNDVMKFTLADIQKCIRKAEQFLDEIESQEEERAGG